MRVIAILLVLSCGPDGRARDPGYGSGIVVPDLSTGAEDPGDPRLDLPQWPDLPADSSSSGAGSTSTGGEDSSSGSSSTGQGSTGATTASTGGDASTGSSSGGDSSGGSSSTGPAPEPTGCPCEPGIMGFCDLPPGTCGPTKPGGYCDPNGDGAYLDGDFNAGYLDWKGECA